MANATAIGRGLPFSPSATKKRAVPTVSGHVQLDETLKVLHLGREALDLVVAQAKSSETRQPKEILQENNDERTPLAGEMTALTLGRSFR